MLINSNKVSKDDIVSFKLISGEEIIAKFVSDSEKTYEFLKPLVLAQGAKGMMLAPFMLTADILDQMSFLKTALITAPMKTQDQVRASYIQFTTGITVPTTDNKTPPLTV
jgi:hypothetical protein